MFNLLTTKQAALLIGSDLRAAGANDEWRRWGFPGGKVQTRERIDKLFPGSDVAAHVLDVLASGLPVENVAVRLGTRFLCASFLPYPSGEKPKKVLMEAWETPAYLLLDGETGQVLSVNEAASAVLGQTPQSGESFCTEEALDAVARGGSHYRRFTHSRPDGSEVELESLLVLVEAEQQ